MLEWRFVFRRASLDLPLLQQSSSHRDRCYCCIPPMHMFNALYLNNYWSDLAEIFKRCSSLPWEQNTQKNIFLETIFL